MQRKRLLSPVGRAISFAVLWSGAMLMMSSVSGGLTHAFSSPWLILSKIVVPLVMIMGGLWGYIVSLRSQLASDPDSSSRDFDAREPFSQIQTGNFPSDWIVFRAVPRKVWTLSLGFGLVAPGFLSLFVLAQGLLGSFFWPYLAPLLLFLLLSLAIVLPLLIKREVEKTVLVVTPDGFILGNYAKPQKALRLKYRDIIDIKVIGETVTILTRDEIGKRSLNSSVFTSAREIAVALLLAFTRYKSEYPDGAVIAAPVFVSRLAREKQNNWPA